MSIYTGQSEREFYEVYRVDGICAVDYPDGSTGLYKTREDAERCSEKIRGEKNLYEPHREGKHWVVYYPGGMEGCYRTREDAEKCSAARKVLVETGETRS